MLLFKPHPQSHLHCFHIYTNEDPKCHHRWAALVAQDIANGGDGDIEMDVIEVDTPIEELIDQSNEFTKEMGLETKSGDKKK